MDIRDIRVIKKSGKEVAFDADKIKVAVSKSAARVMYSFTDEDLEYIVNEVLADVLKRASGEVAVPEMHFYVEKALEKFPEVQKSYKEYRDYKTSFADMLDSVYQKSKSIRYIGDKENSNSDSALVATKRCLIFNELNKSLYNKFFLTTEERVACEEGFIYIHDKSARLDTFNCCIFDMERVISGGFEMGNIRYTEPKSLETFFGVLGDVILSTAAQQYGGFTIPEVDKLSAPYAKKSYETYIQENMNFYFECVKPGESLETLENIDDIMQIFARDAMQKVERDYRRGWQGLEMKLNTVGSSRGDYPFITMTFGLGESDFEQMANITILQTRMEGQGEPGFKKPVLFPKLVFLYDKELHGKHGKLRHIFNAGVECSSKTMYPDWLSLSGKGYVASMYQKYKTVISPMGCRAFLSPWYRDGGIFGAFGPHDVPRYVGRFNIGVVSLNLPMILAESKELSKELDVSFWNILDKYLEMGRNLHKRTYEYLGELRASVNPVAFCEGGLYGGTLRPHQKLKESMVLLQSATASFGITALNELQMLYNGKSLVQDREFALEVMHYIVDKIDQFKKEDGKLYAIYGTPAESLCGLQVEQFKARFGIVKGVSDRPYFSNSFHCHVTEDITPIEKQDYEEEFWDFFNGGKIQYVRYPINYNREAIETLIERAMEKGFYEGVNMALSYCDDCGYQELDMDECPRCGSRNLTKIDRMNGYLSYSRIHGDSRLNDAKMAEISERKSM